ncbi:MAG: glutaredoxin domain-containing protein [Gammaproteobacteria bacterium]|nr:glutaredoxin domain-containing protein [Gammaproteobacteria bacterium]
MKTGDEKCATLYHMCHNVPAIQQLQEIFMIDASNTAPSDTRPQHFDNGVHFVDSAIADRENPVSLFSLSWCSYCRGAKQLLTQLGIPHQVFELDRGGFLEPRLQREVRSRLQELTRSGTLPQLFIGGDSVGGYTETYTASRNGTLTKLLEKHHITITKTE